VPVLLLLQSARVFPFSHVDCEPEQSSSSHQHFVNFHKHAGITVARAGCLRPPDEER